MKKFQNLLIILKSSLFKSNKKSIFKNVFIRKYNYYKHTYLKISSKNFFKWQMFNCYN